MQFSNDFLRRIRTPAYLVALFLMIGSLIEVVIPSWPPRFHELNWRLSVTNTAAGATGTELLALLILVVVAQLARSSGALWMAFWASVVVAVGYGLGGGVFILDALQVRARIPGDQLSRYDMTVGWALIRFAFTEVASLWIAASALAAASNLRREVAESLADPRASLVLGATGRPATTSAAASTDA